MRSPWALLPLSLTLWALPVTAWAARPLSLSDALAAALEANPDLQAAELAVAQADADVRTANGQFDPTLSLSSGFDRSSSLFFLTGFPEPFNVDSTGWNAATSIAATAPTGTSLSVDARLRQSRSEFVGFTGDVNEQLQFAPSFTATLSQELLRGIKLSYNLQQVKSAGLAQTRAQLQADAARQQALSDVARSYWQWVYQSELATIGEDSVAAAEEALRVARERVAAGEVAPLEEVRLSAALVQAKTTALDARNAAQDASDSLLLLLGEAPGEQVVPSSLPGEAPEMTLTVSAVTEAAIAGNVDLAVSRTQVDEARLALAAARHERLPSLTADLTGGVAGGNDQSWGEAFGQLDGFPTVAISGRFAVPLGNRAATGRARRAEGALQVAETNLSKAERQVAAQAATQARTLTSAREKVALADANEELAKRTLAAQEALYDAGRIILSEVLDARSQYNTSRAEAVKARTDYRLAEVELLRLQGKVTAEAME